jgi:predicted AAA+ superfamily ATPase
MYIRHQEYLINRLITLFPSVVIYGARQAGKSTLCKTICSDWKEINLELESTRELVSTDPYLYLSRNSNHLLIDEAQLVPSLFPALQVIIDADRKQKGRFVITGSSSPELTKEVSESLAGRAGIVELGTLKISEIAGRPISPLYNLLGKKSTMEELLSLRPNLTREDVFFSWLKGGYPEPRESNDPFFHQAWMESYRKTYLERDVRRLYPELDLSAFQLFLTTLAGLSGSIVNITDIGKSLGKSQQTIREFLHIAEGTFIWRTIPSYGGDTLKRIAKHPKGMLRDSGLLNFLLHLHSEDLLLSHPRRGSLWESFIMEEIIKGFSCANIPAQYSYYRTRDRNEIDLIIEGPGGVIPIEIKSSTKVDRRTLTTLSDFIEEKSLPYGLLINNADTVELVAPKIIQIPATLV